MFKLPFTNTRRFIELTETDIYASELIISAADSSEDRGQLPLWRNITISDPDRVIWIRHIDKENIGVRKGQGNEFKISLRNENEIDLLLSSSHIIIDISCLQLHVWAPLLKSAHKQRLHTRILYIEPKSYKAHPSPASSSLFDLSSTYGGLSPLPGFARLGGAEDENKCLFVAMLGFEGNRPERLALQIEPPPTVIPVVGVPGFQIEYPAFTVASNRGLLKDYFAYSEIRFARASCPFSAFQVLLEIQKCYPNHYLYLAPVGTKPHSLGTILFAIINPETTEIMFDHPVTKAGGTKGLGVMHIYDFENFNEF